MKWIWTVTLIALTWGVPPLHAQGVDKGLADGPGLYAAHCADCHRANGQGLPAKFPALDKNPFVTGDPSRVIETVLNGRKGNLGLMPAWKDTLNDDQAAAVVTYIRRGWSNQGAPVAAPMVRKMRR